MKVVLDRVNVVRKRLSDGSVREYHYHRDTGKRIQGEPGTLAFFASYEQAATRDEIDPSRTLSALLLAYQNSAEFAGLAKSTKAKYRTHLNEIRGKFGTRDLAAFEDKKIKAELMQWRDEVAQASASSADHLMRVFRLLLKWGENRNIIERNYLAGVKRVYNPDRSEMIWSPEQVAALLKVASPEMAAAVRFALLTGQRQGDILALRWADYNPDTGMLWLKQQKTKAPVGLPVFGALKELIDSLPRRAETMLTNASGGRWTLQHFRRRFDETRQAAGLAGTGLHFHDFRGTAITTLADAGCTEAQIAAVTGHSLQYVSAILKKYLKRTVSQARAGIEAINGSWIGSLQTRQPTECLTH